MNFSHWPTICKIACQALITGQSFEHTVNSMYNRQAAANEVTRARYLQIKKTNRVTSTDSDTYER